MHFLISNGISYHTLASFPVLLTPTFVTCSTNVGKGLVKHITCSDLDGHWVDVWMTGTFPGKLQRPCLSFVASPGSTAYTRVVVCLLFIQLWTNGCVELGTQSLDV